MIQKKADKSGISYGTLKKVYDRGMAAWKTGHRPGTAPQQWGYVRVNAFIVKRKKGNLNHDKGFSIMKTLKQFEDIDKKSDEVIYEHEQEGIQKQNDKVKK